MSDTDQRPTEHGGGEASAPIAGAPESFPSDAELARTLLEGQSRATLSTLTADGFPYGSAVSYAVDEQGCPVVLVSDMAEHTVNARKDGRASLLVAAAPAGGDPLSAARCTLVGHMQLLEDPGPIRDRYLERHPYASYYVDFTDFGFWRLDVERCRFVGGFGHMSWVTPGDYRQADVDPVADDAPGVVEHMNDDHADANLLYVQRLAGLADATEATLAGVDRYGLTLQAATPAGPRMARVAFPSPLTSTEEIRPAVIDLLDRARSATP